MSNRGCYPRLVVVTNVIFVFHPDPPSDRGCAINSDAEPSSKLARDTSRLLQASRGPSLSLSEEAEAGAGPWSLDVRREREGPGGDVTGLGSPDRDARGGSADSRAARRARGPEARRPAARGPTAPPSARRLGSRGLRRQAADRAADGGRPATHALGHPERARDAAHMSVSTQTIGVSGPTQGGARPLWGRTSPRNRRAGAPAVPAGLEELKIARPAKGPGSPTPSLPPCHRRPWPAPSAPTTRARLARRTKARVGTSALSCLRPEPLPA